MEAVLVALIVALGGGGMTLFGQWLLRRQDYARQDEVAARVAQVAIIAAENVEKVDDVHRIVTGMQRYQAVLLDALTKAGVAIPPDESLK